MAKVKILIDGYARKIEGGWVASSTTTLIESGGRKIIIDPGCNRKKLIKSLAQNGLKTADIGCVLLTHSHTDHILLDGIFENARLVTSMEIYENDRQTDHYDKIPGLGIEIIKTPGHSSDSRTFIIKTEEGIYAIAGDIFWWKDDEEQKTDFGSLINHTDPYVKDKETLMKSRRKVLELADFVVPGHGKVFEVKK